MNKNAADSPLISVVMATYNQAQFLPRAIDSVLAQTLKDFEFIIVDDGSTDNTPEVLSHYEKLDSRIKIITQDNQGLASSRNNGVAAARGKYIAFMDSDDACAHNRLEVQLKMLRDNPAASACACSVLAVQDYAANKAGHADHTLLHNEQPVFSTKKLGGILGPNAFLTKQSFIRTGGYRTQVSIIEDMDFTLRYSRHYKWIFLEGASLYYYRHPNPKRRDQLSSQDVLKLVKRHIACFVSEWCRHNNLPDPVEEGQDLEIILSQAAAIGRRDKCVIYKTMYHFIGQVALSKNISSRGVRWYLLGELKYAYPMRLVIWILLELGELKYRIKNRLRFLKPILAALKIRQPLDS